VWTICGRYYCRYIDVCEVICECPLLCSSFSSSQRSVSFPGCFTISSSLISVTKAKTLSTYSNCSIEIWRRSLSVSWSTKLCRRWRIYWQGLPRQAGRYRETGERNNLPVPQHCWMLGVDPKPYLVKYKLFQIPKRSLGYVDIYQEVLRARKWATKLVLGMCELSLKGSTGVTYRTAVEL